MKSQLSLTERVHPYVETPPLQYPSVGSDDHNQHGNQIPNNLMQKEQKEGLIEQPIVNGNYEGFNQEAQTATVRQRTRISRRRRCCVRCCCCMGACVGAFVVIVGILVMLFFLVLHPKLPKYTITEGSISKFSMSNYTTSSNSSAAIASAILGGNEEEEAGTVYLSVEMQLTARMRNPNTKIGIDYRELSGRLLYEGVEIGEGSIPAFYQGHENTTYVGLAMQGRDIALTPSLAKTLAYTLNNEESIVLRARAIALVRLKIGRWKSHTSKVRVKCTIQLSNPTRGSVRLLHDTCKFKLLRLHL